MGLQDPLNPETLDILEPEHLPNRGLGFTSINPQTVESEKLFISQSISPGLCVELLQRQKIRAAGANETLMKALGNRV